MMTFITRMLLNYRAYKDANYVMQNNGQFNGIPAWMQKKADDYKMTIERNATKKGRGVMRTYSKIKQFHSLLKEENDKETAFQKKNQEKVDSYSQEISEREKQIEAYENMLSEAHKGSSVPAGLTMERIHSNIKILRKEIEALEADRDMQITVGEERSQHKQIVEKYTRKVRQLKSKFVAKVNAVHIKNERVRLAYDKQFSFYWEKIQLYIELKIKKDKISDAAPVNRFPMEVKDIVGTDICKAERLFESERRFINETVNNDFNIYYEV